MKVKFFTGLVAIAAVLFVAAPIFAQRSSTESYGNKTIVVTGVVTKVEWTNPSVMISLDAKDEAGKPVTYTFDSGPPSILHRAGVRQNDFKVGETVTVTATPPTGGTNNLGRLEMIKHQDGHVFVYRYGSE